MIGTNRRILLCGVLFVAILLARPEASAQGTAGFEILRLQTQPRGSALGGALVADAGSIESAFYNPAGLVALAQRTAAAGYMNYLLDIQSGHLAYADPTFTWGVLSANLTYTNYGDFDGRSSTGQDMGSFTASDLVLGAAIARQVHPKISLGASGKFVYSDIEDYTGTALALDLGGQYTFIPDRFRIGAGIYNLGLTTKAYVSQKDDLPLYYRIGVWGIPEGLPANLFFSLTLHHEYADNYSLGNMSGSDFLDFLGDIYYSFGAEFHPVETADLRVGYDTRGLDQRVGTRADAFAGICGGFGFDFTLVRMDYGLASYGELGLVQRIALTAGF